MPEEVSWSSSRKQQPSGRFLGTTGSDPSVSKSRSGDRVGGGRERGGEAHLRRNVAGGQEVNYRTGEPAPESLVFTSPVKNVGCLTVWKLETMVMNGWILWKFPCHLISVLSQEYWAKQVEILMFPSPTGCLLTSFGFPLLIWGINSKFLWVNDSFSEVLKLLLVISQPVHL